jgi:hypothetical protein
MLFIQVNQQRFLRNMLSDRQIGNMGRVTKIMLKVIIKKIVVMDVDRVS